MHPGFVLFVLAATLVGAASIPLMWWLGVWGYLAAVAARVRVLEQGREIANADVLRRLDALSATVDGLKAKLSREDGLRGRAKQLDMRAAADAREAELAAAAQEQVERGEVPTAALAELAALPDRKKRLRAAPQQQLGLDAPDVITDAA